MTGEVSVLGDNMTHYDRGGSELGEMTQYDRGSKRVRGQNDTI